MNQIQLDHKAMLKDHKIEIARLEAILVEKEKKIAELSKANKFLLSRLCAAVADIKQLKAALEDIHQECFMQSSVFARKIRQLSTGYKPVACPSNPPKGGAQ